jgi:ribosomal protein L29
MDMREIKRLSDEEIAMEATRLRRRIFDLRTQSVTDKVVD